MSVQHSVGGVWLFIEIEMVKVSTSKVTGNQYAVASFDNRGAQTGRTRIVHLLLGTNSTLARILMQCDSRPKPIWGILGLLSLLEIVTCPGCPGCPTPKVPSQPATAKVLTLLVLWQTASGTIQQRTTCWQPAATRLSVRCGCAASIAIAIRLRPQVSTSPHPYTVHTLGPSSSYHKPNQSAPFL